jgi:peptidoglycan/LPS O-acetylase OafA/YrhL
VVAVVAYHLGYLSGGFLGVDVFFVLSGFLITSLLLRERTGTGRVRLRAFWERRARRLLPALGVALIGVVIASRVILRPSRLPAVRTDALATALYVANWRFALQTVGGYFATTAPSPLRHAWSLSIEEQFYVLWPLVVLAVAALAARRRHQLAGAVGATAAVGALASAAWMAVHVGTWTPNRLYLGTDTRAMAPLTGGALAGLGYREIQRRAGRHRRTGGSTTAVTVAGFVPLALLAAATVLASPDDTWLYRGGFLLVAVVAAGAVVACLSSASAVARALAVPPLRWLGTRSYGIYLYTWPIQVFAVAEGLDGAALAAVTVGLGLAVAETSYRWIEMPVRRRGGRAIAGSRSWWRGWSAPAGAAAAVLAVVLLATLTSARPSPLETATDAQLHAEALHPVVTAAPSATRGNHPLRVLVAGDSVAYTLGHFFPTDLPGITVDSRGVTGCGLMTDGVRPPGIEKIGGPPTYDNCLEPVTEADRLGLAGDPDIVLFVTGAWERTDHLRDGRLVGPGDTGWTDYIKGLLRERLEKLTSGGAKVALWSEPCGIDAEAKRRETWFTQEVLEPVAAERTDTVVIDPTPVVCRNGRARNDIPGVGSPRPDDGEHWNAAGDAWLWKTWLGPKLEAVARS